MPGEGAQSLVNRDRIVDRDQALYYKALPGFLISEEFCYE
jgi:hypothetical protein